MATVIGHHYGNVPESFYGIGIGATVYWGGSFYNQTNNLIRGKYLGRGLVRWEVGSRLITQTDNVTDRWDNVFISPLNALISVIGKNYPSIGE